MIKHTCEVSNVSKGENFMCGKKATKKVKDCVCLPPNRSFWVCNKHGKEFVDSKHYKFVKPKEEGK